MTSGEGIREAVSLINLPGKWTDGYYARTSEGLMCHELSTEATCFCAMGALRVVVGHKEADLVNNRYWERFGRFIPQDNDTIGLREISRRLLRLAEEMPE